VAKKLYRRAPGAKSSTRKAERTSKFGIIRGEGGLKSGRVVPRGMAATLEGGVTCLGGETVVPKTKIPSKTIRKQEKLWINRAGGGRNNTQ